MPRTQDRLKSPKNFVILSKKIGLILVAFDAVALDAVASNLLGHKPSSIEYLKIANGRLGSMDDIEILED